MQVQEAFEEYLTGEMSALCASDQPTRAGPSVGRTLIDRLGLFGAAIPFERINDALGPGVVMAEREIEDAPESLRMAVEHRYSFPRWPLFEFAIFESENGLAWGHRFVRRTGVEMPPITGLGDLSRWSHVETEVRAALGEPESREGWSPWEAAIYHIEGAQYVLCYVYGLLQGIRRHA